MPELTPKALKWIFLPDRVKDDYVAEFFDFRTISSTLSATVVHWPLYFLAPDHWVRIKAMNIINDVKFSTFILLMILINSVMLALDDPSASSDTSLAKALAALDYVFLVIFICEMCLKITALGFVLHRYSYLRDAWNCLDFTVVVAGIVQVAAGGSGLTALRVFRVFRPLRSVARVETLREILNKLVTSLPRLSDVFALMIFISWFAAVLGINLFAGQFDYRCFYDESYYNSSVPTGTFKIIQNLSSVVCDTQANDVCSDLSGLQAPTVCMYDETVEGTLFSFTNIGTALLLSLKLISRDNWPTLISTISSGVGIGSFVYFFIVTFFGGYFCLNLFIAVLTAAFQVSDDVEPARKEFPYRMRFAHSLGGSIFTDGALTVCHESRIMGGSSSNGGTNVVVGADGAFHHQKSKRSQHHGSSHLHTNTLGAALQELSQAQQQQQQDNNNNNNNGGVFINNNNDDDDDRNTNPGSIRSNMVRIPPNGATDNNQQQHDGESNSSNSDTNKSQKQQQGSSSLWTDLANAANNESNDGYQQKRGGRNGRNNRRGRRQQQQQQKTTEESSSSYDDSDDLDEVAAARIALSRRRASLMAASMRGNNNNNNNASTRTNPPSSVEASPTSTQQQQNYQNNNASSRRPSAVALLNNQHESSSATNEPISNNTTNDLANNSQESYIQHQQQHLMMMRQQQQDMLAQRQQMRNEMELQQMQQIRRQERKKNKPWFRWSAIKRWTLKTGWEPLHNLVISVPYTLFVMVITFVFAVALSLDGVDRDASTVAAIDGIALGCNIFFIVDVALKLIGLGPSFIYSVSNWMDFILAALSIPDLIAQSSNSLSALRAFRLLRLLRVAKQWKSLQRLLSLVLASLKSVASLSLVALIFIYIFAILGFQLFNSDVPDSRFSFSGVFDSLLTVFVIVTGENWSDMTAAMVPVWGYPCIFYFVPIFILGNFFIANLFIAIIIDSFAEVGSIDDEDSDEDDAENRDSDDDDDYSDDDDDDDFNSDDLSASDRDTHNNSDHGGVDDGNVSSSSEQKRRAAARRRRRRRRRRQQREAKKKRNNNGDDVEMEDRDTDDASLPSEVRAAYNNSSGASRDLLAVIHSNRQVLVPCDDSSDDEPIQPADQVAGGSRRSPNNRLYENNRNNNNNEDADDKENAPLISSSRNSGRRARGSSRIGNNNKDLARKRAEENTTLQLATRLGVNVDFDDQRQQQQQGRSSTTSFDASGNPVTSKALTTGKLLKDFVHSRNITNETLSLVPDCDLLSRAAAREMEHVERIRHEEQRLAQHAVAFVTLSRVKKQAEQIGGNYGKLRDDDKKEEFRTVAEIKSLEEKYEGANYRSLFLFEVDNKYRMQMVDLLKHPIFNYCILFLIVVSGVLLAFDTPQVLESIPEFSTAITVTDYIIAIAFAFEMVIRIISLGGFLHPGGYFRSIWNIVDFLVTLLSIIALGVPALKPVRIIRIVRLTAQTFHMRIVITSLLQALPGMTSVVVFMLFVWWIFAIVGVASFKGTFNACNDITMNRDECIGNYTIEVTQYDGSIINETVQREWASLLPSSNFDDVPYALYTLLKLSLGDGWFDIMYTALDSPGIGLAPVRNSNIFAALYFVVFMIVGNFFILNLFTGVLADRFVSLRQRGSGYHLLSEAQKQWVLAQRVLFRTEVPITPPCPKNPIRRWCFYEVQTKRFDYFFTAIIVLQSIQLSMYTSHMSSSYESTLDAIGIVMLCLFTVEIVMKMLAFNPILFWRTTWNQVDLVIVAMSWIGVFVGNQIALIRVFRVFRLILLLRKLQGIQTLFIALYQAVPELINVGVVLTVVYTIFAVLGVALFSNIPATDPLTPLVNFQNVGSALILLYVSMTTEGWGDLADACGVQPPDCDPDAGTCGNRALSYFYFITYMFVMSMILINLLVTVVLGNFNDAEIAEEQETLFQVIQEFRDRWAENDPDGTQKLDVSVVLRLLPTLPPAIWDHNPLKVRGKSLPMWIHFLRQLQRFHIPIGADHSCTYRDVIASLALRLFCVNVEDAIRSSRTTSEGVTWDEKLFSIHHHFAALKLSRVARRFIRARGERLALRQLREIKEQHTILIEAEYVPLRKSHEEAVALARFALKRAADAQNQATQLRKKLEDVMGMSPPSRNMNNKNSNNDAKENEEENRRER